MTEFTDDMKYIIDLEEENKKLREELKWYKKQYQHSMGEGKLTKGGFASFDSQGNLVDYGESKIGDRRFMEEDTLQELRDIGEI